MSSEISHHLLTLRVVSSPEHDSVRFAIVKDVGRNSGEDAQTDPSQGSSTKGALLAWCQEHPKEALNTIGTAFCLLRQEITDCGASRSPNFPNFQNSVQAIANAAKVQLDLSLDESHTYQSLSQAGEIQIDSANMPRMRSQWPDWEFFQGARDMFADLVQTATTAHDVQVALEKASKKCVRDSDTGRPINVSLTELSKQIDQDDAVFEPSMFVTGFWLAANSLREVRTQLSELLRLSGAENDCHGP